MEVWYSMLRHYHDPATLLQQLIMSWFNRQCVIVKLELLLVGLLPIGNGVIPTHVHS